MKVLIIDDDKLVAMSLRTIIEQEEDIDVVDTGFSGEEAISLYEKHEPDVLLMDIRMKGMTGLEAGEQIIEKHNNAKILYLTTFNDNEYIIKAINIGARGYIIKQDFEGIVPALRAVNEGQNVYGNDVVESMQGMIGKPAGGSTFDFASYGLTEQEAEVVKCVADGLSNREIADTLYLSEGTVRNYLSNILHKLDIRDRTNLAIFYLNEKNK